jgi:hypothetical protein
METNTERNRRVQELYDELMAGGKHGQYETIFRIVRLEVEAERARCKERALEIVGMHRNDYNNNQIGPLLSELRRVL